MMQTVLNTVISIKQPKTAKIHISKIIFPAVWFPLIALADKLLRQGYRYHKLRRAFSKFYRRNSELVEKYNVSLRKRLQQGISEPDFYGDLVYRIRKIMGKSIFFWTIQKAN